jgi:hypothetical protein
MVTLLPPVAGPALASALPCRRSLRGHPCQVITVRGLVALRASLSRATTPHLHPRTPEPRASLARSHFAGLASLLPRRAFRRTPWLRPRYGHRVPASAHARLYVVVLLGHLSWRTAPARTARVLLTPPVRAAKSCAYTHAYSAPRCPRAPFAACCAHSSTCRARQSRAPTLLLRPPNACTRHQLPHARSLLPPEPAPPGLARRAALRQRPQPKPPTTYQLCAAPSPVLQPPLTRRSRPPAHRLPRARLRLSPARAPEPCSACAPLASARACLHRAPPLGPPARLAPSTTAPSRCRPRAWSRLLPRAEPLRLLPSRAPLAPCARAVRLPATPARVLPPSAPARPSAPGCAGS